MIAAVKYNMCYTMGMGSAVIGAVAVHLVASCRSSVRSSSSHSFSTSPLCMDILGQVG